MRFLLALSVVTFHAGPAYPIHLVDGFNAVSIFFVISGFYMTLILNGKYDTYGPFITNRLLKLFPAYLVSIAVAHALAPIPFGDLPLWPRVYFIFANLFMLFSELTAIIIRLPSGSFGIMPLGGWWTPETGTWGLLYNGPVWSLGVEMMFYLIAPLVVKIDAGYLRRIAILIAASLLCNLALYWVGALHVPWDYNFFPPNLYLFMLGSLSFYLFKTGRLQALLPYRQATALVMFAALLVLTLGYQELPGRIFGIAPLALYIALLFVLMPYIFEALKQSRVDRAFGELSYPVYIVHYVVLTRMPFLKGIDPLVASVGMAILTYFVVMLPIEKFVRARVVQ